MGRSLKLFSVRGIDIRLHFTFPLILLWAAWQFGLMSGSLSGAWLGVIVISLLFVLVTLHELGHSFAALHYGVPVEQIMLSPIGGIAQLQRMPEKPIQEFVIAVAGPAVNLLAAMIMVLFIPLFDLTAVDFAAILSNGAGLTGTAVFTYVFAYNIFLAVFNLIPAFPLDGGRVFRALLAMKLDYVRATSIAATVGRLVAVFLGIYALFNGAIFLVFIAFFIYMAAGQEASFVRQRGALQGFRVRDVYSPSAYTVTPYTTLQQTINLMMISGQGSFPVVQGEQLEGFVTQGDLSQAVQTRGAHAWVNMIMRRNVEPVTPAMPILAVQERLHEEQLDALPVVENGRYAGLIGRWQINQLLRWNNLNGNVRPHPQSA